MARARTPARPSTRQHTTSQPAAAQARTVKVLAVGLGLHLLSLARNYAVWNGSRGRVALFRASSKPHKSFGAVECVQRVDSRLSLGDVAHEDVHGAIWRARVRQRQHCWYPRGRTGAQWRASARERSGARARTRGERERARSPSSSVTNATTLGVVGSPLALRTMRGVPVAGSMMATHEFVVPRSMPAIPSQRATTRVARGRGARCRDARGRDAHGCLARTPPLCQAPPPPPPPPRAPSPRARARAAPAAMLCTRARARVAARPPRGGSPPTPPSTTPLSRARAHSCASPTRPHPPPPATLKLCVRAQERSRSLACSAWRGFWVRVWLESSNLTYFCFRRRRANFGEGLRPARSVALCVRATVTKATQRSGPRQPAPEHAALPHGRARCGTGRAEGSDGVLPRCARMPRGGGAAGAGRAWGV